MKLTFIFLLISLSVSAQYPKGSNLIVIGHNSDNILKELKLILTQSDYSIRSYDPEINLIETDYKTVRNIKNRLVILISDSTVTFKGFSAPAMSTTVYAGGIGVSGTGEMRNEFSLRKSLVTAKGFDEMEEIASKIYVKYLKTYDVRIE